MRAAAVVTASSRNLRGDSTACSATSCRSKNGAEGRSQAASNAQCSAVATCDDTPSASCWAGRALRAAWPGWGQTRMRMDCASPPDTQTHVVEVVIRPRDSTRNPKDRQGRVARESKEPHARRNKARWSVHVRARAVAPCYAQFSAAHTCASPMEAREPSQILAGLRAHVLSECVAKHVANLRCRPGPR